MWIENDRLKKYSANISMLAISQHMALPEEMHVIEDDRLTELPIHYAITERTNPEGMVVLMPSALAAGRADRDKIIYTRSSWQGSWPNAQVMSIPDPAIQIDNRLNGAWFINPHHDVISNLADIVKENAAAANIPHERIVFYGSSLGGVRSTRRRLTCPRRQGSCGNPTN